MVQTSPISDNSLMYDTGQGAGECKTPKTDHDLFFRHWSYPVVVEYENTGEDPVECQHEAKRYNKNPQKVMIGNNNSERERTQENSHYQSEIQGDRQVSVHLVGCQVDLRWKQKKNWLNRKQTASLQLPSNQNGY